MEHEYLDKPSYIYTRTVVHVEGQAEVCHGWDEEDQGRGQAGRLDEIITSIHFTLSFPQGRASLMIPGLHPRSHLLLYSLSIVDGLV